MLSYSAENFNFLCRYPKLVSSIKAVVGEQCVCIYVCVCVCLCSSDGKMSACNVGDLGSIPELEQSTDEGNGNPLQYSYLENPMDGGAW